MRSRLAPLAAAVLLTALAAGLAPPAEAQTGAPPDSLALPEVTVTAAPTALPTSRAPARVTVLTQTDVQAAGAATVADLVEARSAAFVKRYGPGGLASFALRGASASQTLVLLDGHRIADPQLGQLDASLLPTAILETVEVRHGPASGLYGTDAVGGVIALRTARPGAQVARVVARTGAFGERALSGFVAGPVAGTGLRLVAAGERAAETGDYLYVDSTAFDIETQTNGVTLPRANADVLRTSLFARLDGAAGRHRAGAGVLLTDAERGLFDFGGATAARQRDRALRAWADGQLRVGQTRLDAGASVQRSALRYQNPALGLDDEGTATLAGLDLRAERPFTRRRRRLDRRRRRARRARGRRAPQPRRRRRRAVRRALRRARGRLGPARLGAGAAPGRLARGERRYGRGRVGRLAPDRSQRAADGLARVAPQGERRPRLPHADVQRPLLDARRRPRPPARARLDARRRRLAQRRAGGVGARRRGDDVRQPPARPDRLAPPAASPTASTGRPRTWAASARLASRCRRALP